MRFSDARVKEAFERSSLKFSVFCLSIISLVFGILLAFDLSKEAILIERGCESKLLAVSSASQTKEEIQTFVEQAVKLRFDSKVSHDPSAFMLQDLYVARAKEQDELKRSGIDQRIIVRSVKLNNDFFLIEADRIVAVGKARSAIPTTLVARISSKGRSLTNPYGLVLTNIDQLKQEKKNE